MKMKIFKSISRTLRDDLTGSACNFLRSSVVRKQSRPCDLPTVSSSNCRVSTFRGSQSRKHFTLQPTPFEGPDSDNDLIASPKQLSAAAQTCTRTATTARRTTRNPSIRAPSIAWKISSQADRYALDMRRRFIKRIVYRYLELALIFQAPTSVYCYTTERVARVSHIMHQKNLPRLHKLKRDASLWRKAESHESFESKNNFPCLGQGCVLRPTMSLVKCINFRMNR